MKVTRFKELYPLKEGYTNTPESLIKIVLNKLKKKIEAFFTNEELANIGDNDNNQISSNLELISSEISLYSPINDTYTIKFSDGLDSYTLIFIISLDEAVGKDSIEDIDNVTIKFKKYNYDFEISSQITKTISIKDIDSNMLIELKLELDEDDNENDDDFKIEI